MEVEVMCCRQVENSLEKILATQLTTLFYRQRALSSCSFISHDIKGINFFESLHHSDDDEGHSNSIMFLLSSRLMVFKKNF